MSVLEVDRLKPTLLGHLTALSGSILLAFYVFASKNQALLLIGSILLALPLASYLYIFLIIAETGRKIVFERVVSGTPIEGFATPVSVIVQSRSLLAAGILTIEDEPPEDVSLVTPPRSTGILQPAGEIELRYILVPRIGSRRFGKLKVKMRDLLGLSEAQLKVRPYGENILAGYPSRALAQSRGSLKALEDPYTKPTALLVRRHGTEIYAIREFQEGDELRLIDWKATARLGKLFVKELRRETTVPLIIVFMPSPRSVKGEPFKTVFELLARSIVWIAREVILREGSIGYLGLTSRDPVASPPLPGSEGMSRLLESISITPLPEQPSLPPLQDTLIEYLRRHSPGRPVIVIATDDVWLREAWKLMDPISRRGFKVGYLSIVKGEPLFAMHESLSLKKREEGEGKVEAREPTS